MAEASAEAQDEAEYIAFRKLLDKAQTAHMDDIEAIAAQLQEQRDSALALEEETFREQNSKYQRPTD